MLNARAIVSRRPLRQGPGLLRYLSSFSPTSAIHRRYSQMTVEQPDWRRVAARDGVPAYNMFTRPIVRSQQDDREYRVIKLDNGVEAMLVHDAKADKAAASLDVAVGHLYDPVCAIDVRPLYPADENAG